MKRATLADFLDALGASGGELPRHGRARVAGPHRAQRDADGKTAAPLDRHRRRGWIGELHRQCRRASASRCTRATRSARRSSTRRFIPGIPSTVQIAYLVGLVQGVIGIGRSRARGGRASGRRSSAGVSRAIGLPRGAGGAPRGASSSCSCRSPVRRRSSGPLCCRFGASSRLPSASSAGCVRGSRQAPAEALGTSHGEAQGQDALHHRREPRHRARDRAARGARRRQRRHRRQDRRAASEARRHDRHGRRRDRKGGRARAGRSPATSASRSRWRRPSPRPSRRFGGIDICVNNASAHVAHAARGDRHEALRPHARRQHARHVARHQGLPAASAQAPRTRTC